MIGAYALGKAQRVIRLIRDGGYHEPIYIHGSLQRLCDYYEAQGIKLGTLLPANIRDQQKGRLCRKDRDCTAIDLCSSMGAAFQ